MESSVVLEIIQAGGVAGAILLLLVVWVQRRMATGKLIFVSVTASALEARNAELKKELEAEITRRETAERCSACHAAEATAARERLLAHLDTPQEKKT